LGGQVFVLGLFLVTWNKRFFGYDRGLFWVFVLGYWSYGKKIWVRVGVPSYSELFVSLRLFNILFSFDDAKGF